MLFDLGLVLFDVCQAGYSANVSDIIEKVALCHLRDKQQLFLEECLLLQMTVKKKNKQINLSKQHMIESHWCFAGLKKCLILQKQHPILSDCIFSLFLTALYNSSKSLQITPLKSGKGIAPQEVIKGSYPLSHQ